MDEIPADAVLPRDRFAEAPVPAGRHAGIEQIMDVVVLHQVAIGMRDEHADAAGENQSAVVDVVVRHRHAGRPQFCRIICRRAADADAARAQFVQFVVVDENIGAARTRLDAVPTGL